MTPERLAEIEKALDRSGQYLILADELAELVAAAKANARLREALAEIKNKRGWTGLSPSSLQDAYEDMRRRARAALAEAGASHEQ